MRMERLKKMRLTERDIAEIVKMRGLGYSQAEIAQQLGVSQSAIQYQLARINERARREGNDDIFTYLVLRTLRGFLALEQTKALKRTDEQGKELK